MDHLIDCEISLPEKGGEYACEECSGRIRDRILHWIDGSSLCSACVVAHLAKCKADYFDLGAPVEEDE